MESRFVAALAAMALLLLAAGELCAQSRIGADQGKLPLTAGFSDAEGAGGGGLNPLAFITGYGTSDSWGANAHFTGIRLNDFDLNAYGVAAGIMDRFEISATRHDLKITGTALDGLKVKQNIFGVKVKLFGDAIYMQDSWMPQTAVGLQYKKNRGIENAASVGLPGLVSVKQLGADDEDGIDYYASFTKVFLAQSFLANVNLRYTKANQLGLLGFGGDRHDGYKLEPEATLAYLLMRKLAIGAEYRAKPRNLGVDTEDDAWTAFVAWAPTRNVSVVAAYLNLGSILGPVTGETDDQAGAYVSLQVGF